MASSSARNNELNAFLANHDIPQQRAEVAKLKAGLGLLAADRADAEAECAVALSKKIAERVEEKKRA
ncbi:hypothetical protein [Streptosporangium sp. NPDC049046]|uniref:hypothetical protein n=1 Tax=Streptosporangium sp. NPDC049046 TaxID=3155031 RepID=UPI00341783B8